MSIVTNRLKINFKIDAIAKDFIFIRLKRENKGRWWGAEELDRLIGDPYKAMSVGYAQYAYAMFEKKSNNASYELRQKLQEDPNFTNLSAIEVKPEAVYSGNDECICGKTLARLLINSLGSSRSKFEYLHFSNLTGTLLKIPSLSNKLSGAIGVAEITLSDSSNQNEFLLNVSVATYQKKTSIFNEYRDEELKKILERPQYVVYSGTDTPSLRRLLSSEKQNPAAKESYIKCGKKGKRLHTNFLNFGSIEEFQKSRAGIFHEVYKSIKKHLSEYMDVDLYTLEINESLPLNNTLLKKPEQLHPKLDKQLVHIVDRVNDDRSNDLVEKFKKLLLPYIVDNNRITNDEKDREGALNLRIIHDVDYYEENAQKDEYLLSTDNFQRQNLTIESIESVSDIRPIVKNIITELLIKRDIGLQKLELFDWSKLKTEKRWTFGIYDDKVEKFVFMNINWDGSFNFKQVDKTLIDGCQDYPYYIELPEKAKQDKSKKGFELEGIIVYGESDINLLFKTDEISLPDLFQIESILKEVETELPENKQTGYELAEIVKEFLQQQSGLNIKKSKPLSIEKFQTFSEKLKESGEESISKGKFKSLIAEYLGTKRKGEKKEIDVSNTKEATSFIKYLLENHGIRLKLPQDNQSKEYLFDASLNIKYFGENEEEAYYFVGQAKKDVKFSFKDACHIRKVVAVNGSKLIFRQLLQTMDVDFVRTGQSTVIPFPFKYIREYNDMTNVR